MKNYNITEVRFFFFYLLIIFSSVSSFLQAQPNLEWAKHTAGASNDIGSAVAVDKDDNVYVLGKFSGIADFDPGLGIVSVQSASSNNMFVSKYSPSGNLLWVKTIDANGAAAIYLDDSCNIYTTGNFFQTVDFDPGPGVHNLTSTGSLSNVFICKWDSSGNYIWANNLVSIYQNVIPQGTTISTDDSCNVYICGGIASSVFVAKFNNAGIFIWEKRFGAYLFTNSFVSIPKIRTI